MTEYRDHRVPVFSIVTCDQVFFFPLVLKTRGKGAVGRNCHIKYKLVTSKTNPYINTNCSHEIQNSSHQKESPDMITGIKRSAVGERRLVSTWCNHHIVVSRYFICNITVRTSIPHRPTYSYISCT